VTSLPHGPRAHRPEGSCRIRRTDLYSCRLVVVYVARIWPTFASFPVAELVVSNKLAPDPSPAWHSASWSVADLVARSSGRVRRGGGGVLVSGFCSPASPSRQRMLQRCCGARETVQELVQAGHAGRGPEDGEICSGWLGKRPADLILLLDVVDGELWIRSLMNGLGRGPDRRAPAAKVSSSTTHFRGSQSCLQRWSRVELGCAGFRPSLSRALRRRRRRAAGGGSDAGTSRGFNVIFCVSRSFLHLCGSTCFWSLLLYAYVSCIPAV
jgi:hypothetical protein